RVMRVVPHDNEEVNETWLSDRDRFGYEGLYAPDRLERPLLREGGVLQETDWALALEHAAAHLREVVAAHGPEAVGVLVSPSATLEELYLAQKLARGLGSGNVDHRLRQGDFGADAAMGRAPGLGMRIPELERVDAALLVGSDIRMDQPLLGLRLRKAGMRGAEIAVLNPVDYELYFPVAHRLITDPPGMVRALAAIAADLARHSDVAVPPAVAGLVEGVRVEETHAAVAHALRRAGRGVVVLGAQAHASPWFGALRLLAGYVAAASGAALAELPFGANAAGAWLAGAVPHRGPGGAPAQPAGLDARAMLERPRRAYVLLGVEPERDAWNPAAAARALGEAELVIHVAPWLSEAGRRWAHVALPAAAFAETSGTFVNADGRWQSFEGAARPPGEARPAWKILRVLGTLLDLEGFGYEDPEEIRREVRAAVEAAPEPAGTVAAVALPETAASLWRVGDVPIYAVDALVRRSRPLQETPLAVEAALRVAPGTAARLGLTAGARVRVRQDGTQAELEVVLDRRVADGCALVHAGVPGSEGLGPAVGPLEIVAG
ncbi:MAG TPA: NADH-quinone oxidoreductase subunit G, partial [Chromatiales bacterium]|nr:NADH-quinone oxidoreductase subunit G [Chromatiales bacterium]